MAVGRRLRRREVGRGPWLLWVRRAYSLRIASWIALVGLLCAVMAASFAGGASSQQSESSVASGVSQWTVFGPSAFWLFSGDSRFGLFNNYNRQSVRYQSRDYGINLGWDDKSAGRNITLRRQGTSTQPLVFGEPIAIAV